MSKLNLARLLNQTITYWGAPVKDGYGGFTFASPTTITGRWEDKEVVLQDSRGVEFVSKAVVYLSQEAVLDGYLYLGTSTEADPNDQTGARIIQKTKETPSLSGDLSLYEAWL